MDLILNLLAIFGACLWLTILFLPWRPWSTREYLDATDVDELSYDLGDITVLIPARNEKDTIKKILSD
jgi:cellulose synthase/poly-beta-1,6-N-acetylglucosamine synthase-like glycosyltransferase